MSLLIVKESGVQRRSHTCPWGVSAHPPWESYSGLNASNRTRSQAELGISAPGPPAPASHSLRRCSPKDLGPHGSPSRALPIWSFLNPLGKKYPPPSSARMGELLPWGSWEHLPRLVCHCERGDGSRGPESPAHPGGFRSTDPQWVRPRGKGLKKRRNSRASAGGWLPGRLGEAPGVNSVSFVKKGLERGVGGFLPLRECRLKRWTLRNGARALPSRNKEGGDSDLVLFAPARTVAAAGPNSRHGSVFCLQGEKTSEVPREPENRLGPCTLNGGQQWHVIRSLPQTVGWHQQDLVGCFG